MSGLNLVLAMNKAEIITGLVTLFATFLGVFLAQWLSDRSRENTRKEKFIHLCLGLLVEMELNKVSIKKLRERKIGEFTLDQLVSGATNALLSAQELYKFGDQQLITYAFAQNKQIYIANKMIDFCFENWKSGKWSQIPDLEAANMKTLEEKIGRVEKIMDEIKVSPPIKKILQTKKGNLIKV